MQALKKKTRLHLRLSQRDKSHIRIGFTVYVTSVFALVEVRGKMKTNLATPYSDPLQAQQRPTALDSQQRGILIATPKCPIPGLQLGNFKNI